MSSFQRTANQIKGERLQQSAGYLFDEAATLWYLAASIELSTGLAGAVLVLFDLGRPSALWGAAVGFVLFAIAYALREVATSKYQLGDTMRRQSVLAEALDWEISPSQLGEWERRAGDRINEKVENVARTPSYYTSQEPTGPTRLSHLTSESAFYSKHLYGKLASLLIKVTVVAIIATIAILALPFTKSKDPEFQTMILLVLPVLLSLNVVGWAVRLSGMTNEILEVEKDLERLQAEGDAQLPLVMRLVNEYNCIVVGGIPIHPWWFKRHQAKIRNAWNSYVGQDHTRVVDIEV